MEIPIETIFICLDNPNETLSISISLGKRRVNVEAKGLPIHITGTPNGFPPYQVLLNLLCSNKIKQDMKGIEDCHKLLYLLLDNLVQH